MQKIVTKIYDNFLVLHTCVCKKHSVESIILFSNYNIFQ